MTILKRATWAVCAMIFATALAGCASNSDVRVIKPIKSETLPQKTFAWARGSVVQMMPDGFGEGRAAALSTAITRSLLDKGYVQTPLPRQADLLVSVDFDGDLNRSIDYTHSNAGIAAASTMHGRRYRRHRSRVGHVRRPALATAQVEIEGTVVITIQDGPAGKDLWQGRIRKTLQLSELKKFENDIDDDVEKLFKDFPISGTE